LARTSDRARTARVRDLLTALRAEPVGGRFLRFKRFVYRFTASAFDRQTKVQEALLDAVDHLEREVTRLATAVPPAGREQLPSEDSAIRPTTFAELFGQRTWSDIFSDQTPVGVSETALGWLAAPSQRFIDHVVGRAPLSFEGVPPDPAQHKQPPTYLIAQLHRLWITMQETQRHLRDARLVLDLGAFPFSLDILLREYLRFDGRIIATANLPIQDDWKAELDSRRIEVAHLNLDTHIQDRADMAGMPDQLDLGDGSADLVILTHVIEHLYHPLGVLKEAFRILRPGGRVLVSTDNAFMLDAFLRLGWLGPFLHEPVENTSAMSFHFWRGHNRFFSEADIATMLRAAGFSAIEGRFYEVLYNSFSEKHFLQPTTSLPKWRADILSRIPGYRNEIVVVAEKGSSAGPDPSVVSQFEGSSPSSPGVAKAD